MTEPAKPAEGGGGGGGGGSHPPSRGSHPPSPGYVLGMGLVVCIVLFVASFGLDAIGGAINRNTRALFIFVIIGGIAMAIFGPKKH